MFLPFVKYCSAKSHYYCLVFLLSSYNFCVDVCPYRNSFPFFLSIHPLLLANSCHFSSALLQLLGFLLSDNDFLPPLLCFMRSLGCVKLYKSCWINVSFLQVGNPTATVIALCALRDVSIEQESSQLAILELGGIGILLNILKTDQWPCVVSGFFFSATLPYGPASLIRSPRFYGQFFCPGETPTQFLTRKVH